MPDSHNESALPQERYALAFDAEGALDIAQSLYIALDERGRVAWCNALLCNTLQLPRDAIIGRDWFQDFLPEPLREKYRSFYNKLISGALGPVEHHTSPLILPGGEERIFEWRNVLLHYGPDRIVGTLSSGVDITDRQQTEDALQRSEKDLRDIRWALDQSSIVAITDRKGRITYINEKFCQISGYSEAELLGQDHRILNSSYHPKAFIRDLWQTISSGNVWRGELRNKAKDGHFYWVDTTIVPFLDPEGRPYQYLAIRNDITERKQIQEKLRDQERIAQLGQMAAVLVHEIKNPLAGISGALQVIRGRQPPDSVEARILSEAIKRITALDSSVRELLAYARPRQPRFIPLKLKTAVEETLLLFREDAAMQGIDVTVEGPELWAVGDPELLREAVLNLLLNAGQAMEGIGKIQIELEAVGETARLTVADTGPGIPEAIRERIFEPFFSTRHQGTGLGLARVKQTFESLGGGVVAECPDSGGTRMIATLPRTEP